MQHQQGCRDAVADGGRKARDRITAVEPDAARGGAPHAAALRKDPFR